MNTDREVDVEMIKDSSHPESAGYSHDGWSNISPHSQSSYDSNPLNDNTTYSGYGPHAMFSEPFQSLQTSPAQTSKSSAMTLVNLNRRHSAATNSSAWPSQLITNISPSTTFAALQPSAPVAPVPAPASDPTAAATESPTDDSKSEKEKEKRKTLSSEKKRAMCIFAEQNPGIRQADIGAKFGVERSTVSKVLRHKEQYLKADLDDIAHRKIRGKHPDFDRTLSNYVRRRIQQGFQLSDDEIMGQAKIFASGSANTEGIMAFLTVGWLQKFKQRHGFKTSKLLRRASEADIPDRSPRNFSVNRMRSNGTSPFGLPIVPLEHTLSSSRSDEDLREETTEVNFAFRQEASQSVTSLASDLRENAQSSFSSEDYSPTTGFTFSPDGHNGTYPFDPSLHMSLEYRDTSDMASAIDHTIEYKLPGSSPESTTPRQTPSSTMHITRHVPIAAAPPRNSGPSSSQVRRAGPDVTPRYAHNAVSGHEAPILSVEEPVMPSQEEVRRAANTLLQYLASVGAKIPFDENEYHSFVELTRRLRLQQSMQRGSLSQIPEAEYESAAHFTLGSQ